MSLLAVGAAGGQAGLAAAAVLGEGGDEVVHRREIGRIEDEPAFLAGLHQVGVGEFLEVERQRGRGEAQGLGDFAGGHARRAGLDQQAKDAQAVFLGQGGKALNGLFDFHDSIIMEIIGGCQEKN